MSNALYRFLWFCAYAIAVFFIFCIAFLWGIIETSHKYMFVMKDKDRYHQLVMRFLGALLILLGFSIIEYNEDILKHLWATIVFILIGSGMVYISYMDNED